MYHLGGVLHSNHVVNKWMQSCRDCHGVNAGCLFALGKALRFWQVPALQSSLLEAWAPTCCVNHSRELLASVIFSVFV